VDRGKSGGGGGRRRGERIRCYEVEKNRQSDAGPDSLAGDAQTGRAKLRYSSRTTNMPKVDYQKQTSYDLHL
jgi:hypothetical protein